MKRFRRRLLTFVLFCGSLLVALLLAEAVVRVVAPQKLSVNVTQWDAYVGFVNMPGAKGYGEREDYRMFVTINSRGLRDREFEYAKPPKTVRIGVFGDSFTFGEGVQQDETYAKRLTWYLQQDPGLRARGRVEVLNFGIGKTGTSQQLAFYQKEGVKYGLDLVVLGFFAGNDFDDNWGGVFALQDGTLVHNATAFSFVRHMQRIVMSIPFYTWAASHSHLVNLVRVAATLYDDRRRMNRATDINRQAQTAATDTEEATYALTLRLVEEFHDEVEQRGARFTVALIPHAGQKRLTHYQSGETIPRYARSLERLIQDLADHHVKVVDVISQFERSPDAENCYLPLDRHFNAHGHDVLGRTLAEALRPDVFALTK